MILPYDDNMTVRRPLATLGLLAVMFAFSLWVIAADLQGSDTTAARLLSAAGIVPDHFQPLSLLTYALFHASLAHFLMNAFYLWVFGSGIEAAVGSRRFLLLFFLGGGVGGLLQWLVTTTLLSLETQNTPIVGASAACAGLIGLYAARYYRATLRFVGLPVRVHVVYVVTLYLVLEIGSGLWNLLSGNAADGVAHWAHIGGFVFGLGCAHLLRLADAGECAYLSLDALQAMNKTMPGAAIKKWEALLTRDPANAEARTELARSWLLFGDREQALHEYIQAITACLAQQQRIEAATLYAEMREAGIQETVLSSSQQFAIGAALEELAQYNLAAEVLNGTAKQAETPEAEIALLKTAALYVQHLQRREDALILLRYFLEHYPNSPLRGLAEEWKRVAIGVPFPLAASPPLAEAQSLPRQAEESLAAEPDAAEDCPPATAPFSNSAQPEHSL